MLRNFKKLSVTLTVPGILVLYLLMVVTEALQQPEELDLERDLLMCRRKEVYYHSYVRVI